MLNPERAQQRRDVVLGRMRELKMLDAAAYERARKRAGARPRRPRPGQPAPYFTDHARQEVEERFGLRRTRIVTTLDLTLQRFAENGRGAAASTGSRAAYRSCAAVIRASAFRPS